MKRVYLGLIALLAACTTQVSPGGSAAGDVAMTPAPLAAPSETDLSAAYEGGEIAIERRLATLESYVKWIESRLPMATSSSNALRRTSVTLPPQAFSDVTDEEWERMDAYYDGPELKRLRLIPSARSGDQGTEEFYYDDGKLVFVYYEPDGATKSEPHTETGGDAYYFGREGLIAWVRGDGSRVDPSDADFKAWSKHLLNEAERFPRDARTP
jgi:hypothetical protein